MASPWGKPRNWDLGAKTLIHRGTGISTFVAKESADSQKMVVRYGPGDWRQSSPISPSSPYGTMPRRNTSYDRPSVQPPSSLTRSNSTAILHRSTNMTDPYNRGLSRSSSATFGRAQQPPTKTPSKSPLSRSYSTATLPRNSKLSTGLSRSNSATFGRAQQPLAKTPSKSTLPRSYSTATLPRNSKLSNPQERRSVSNRGDGSLQRSSSRDLIRGSLRRSGSNDFRGSTGTLIRSGSDATINKPSGLTRSSSLSSVTRSNHRERPQPPAKKRHPPVAIKNMNIRANQIIRSQSITSPPPQRNINRSKSMSVVTSPKPNVKYVKYINGYAIQTADSTESDTSSFSRNNSLRRSTGQMGKRNSGPLPRKRVISSGNDRSLRNSRSGSSPRNVKQIPRSFDNYYQSRLRYDEFQESTDAPESTDGPDETSFDCTQFSSESEDDLIMRPGYNDPRVSERPSFQEIRRRRRVSGVPSFPQARPMSCGRRNCIAQIHQISYNMERPPTARELGDFYKDPVMTPKHHLIISCSGTSELPLPQRKKGVCSKTPRRRRNSKIPVLRNRRSSSSDESSIMSFAEYEARFTDSSKPEDSSFIESSLSSDTTETKITETTSPAESENYRETKRVSSLKQFFEGNATTGVKESEPEPKQSSLSSEENKVIAELQNILQREELSDMDTSSVNSANIPPDSNKVRDNRFLSLFSEKHEELIPDHEIKSDIKLLLTSTSGSDDFELLNSDRIRIAKPADDHANTDMILHDKAMESEDAFICGGSLCSLDNNNTGVINKSEEAAATRRARSTSPVDNIRPIRTSLSDRTMAYLESKRTSGDGIMNSICSSIGSILEKSSPYVHYAISEESTQYSGSDGSRSSISENIKNNGSHKKPLRQSLSSPIASKSAGGDTPHQSNIDQKMYYRTVVIEDESTESSVSNTASSFSSDTSQ